MAQPAVPHPASTVVLVRPDHEGRFEIFMNRRPEKMETYAGIYVFPGGRVETTDWSGEMLGLIHGLSPAQAQQTLACDLQPEICLGHWVAAVRELFEEAGVYFFVSESGALASPAQETLTERLAQKRQALQLGELNLVGLLESEQLYCDLSRLTYFFHRITPDHYPVRFDTRFYLAALPVHQSPLHTSKEVAESLWLSPKDALDRWQFGNFPMMPPTLAVLRTLANYGSWQELCAAYRLG
jgi:8-oxo-dGTP pyrophosphatase MutT (NUDIX family)